jgi:hypothetical protein
LVVALILSLFIYSGWASDSYTGKPAVSIQTITEDTHFGLSGDFSPEKEIFTVSLIGDYKIAFALNENISSNYIYYSWKFFDNDEVASTSKQTYSRYQGETMNKEEPVLYYLNQKIGEYDVSVDCYTESPDGAMAYSKTYSGKVSYVGNITKEYTWTYKGNTYSAKTTFGYDEYRSYRDIDSRNKALTESRYKSVTGFVTYKDPAIVTLAESLLRAYGSDRDTSGQGFASFVLAFVQICFKYPPNTSSMGGDLYQYGQEEYFAYPIETLFYDMGECEDTSILAAALFKALGYGAGVVIIPGHAVAAVGLESYDPGIYLGRYYDVLSHTIDGVTYYACETTTQSFQEIGLVSSSGYRNLPYSEYIGKDRYGFYIV